MIAPKIPLVQDGQILSTNLVNSMIGRIEYAADLLRQYKLVAGNEMYVEPHFDGTRVSYNQPVAGGATPTLPLFTESEQKLEKLLNGQVLITEISGYIIDLADVQKIYGEDARLWVRFAGSNIIGGPQFTAARRPQQGGEFVWFVIQVLGFEPFYPNPNYGYMRPLPAGNDPRSILEFFLVTFGSSVSLNFAIGTEIINPFL
jgi:hypothetical protein